jgi:putative membrane protein
MMYDGYGHGNSGDYSWVFMLMMMVLVILGVVLVILYLNRSAHSTSKDDTSLAILNSRYAKGEIEKKEFDEKRKDLMT